MDTLIGRLVDRYVGRLVDRYKWIDTQIDKQTEEIINKYNADTQMYKT